MREKNFTTETRRHRESQSLGKRKMTTVQSEVGQIHDEVHDFRDRVSFSLLAFPLCLCASVVDLPGI